MSKMKKRFHFEWMSQYRDEILGIAIISIIFFHLTEDYRSAVNNNLIDSVSVCGHFLMGYFHIIRSIGVEIFLFLSGVGLFYSFSKTENMLPFYARRFIRIIPTYVLVGVVYWLIRDILIKQTGWLEYFKDITFYSFVKEGNTALWFIFAIIVFYLVYPILYYWFKDNRHKPWMVAIVLILCYVVILFVRKYKTGFYDDTAIMLLRMPVFIVGCYMGATVKNEKKIPMIAAWIFVAAVIIGKVLVVKSGVSSFCWRSYDVVFAIALIMFGCIVLNWIRNAARVRRFLCSCGTVSLELYLTHVPIRRIFKDIGWGTYHWPVYCVVVALSIVIAILLHKYAGYVSKSLTRKLR